MEWAAHSNGGKYPQIRVEGKLYPVRRLIWQIMKGATRSDLWITTNCDNPLCVSPEHLKARTRAKAMKEAVRLPSHNAKIAITKRSKSAMTMEIARQMRASDKTNKELEQETGFPASYISHIRHGHRWKEYVSPFSGLGAR